MSFVKQVPDDVLDGRRDREMAGIKQLDRTGTGGDLKPVEAGGPRWTPRASSGSWLL